MNGLKKVVEGLSFMKEEYLLYRLGSGLKADREVRGFRPDIRVIGAEVDESNGVLWLVLAFSANIGRVSEDDLYSMLYRYFPEFEIDWGRSVGYTDRGIICLALRPFIERIPIMEKEGALDIPFGFKEIGAGMFKFREADGKDSYWKLIKQGEKFYLVRTDGTLPPDVIPPPEVKKKEGEVNIRIGSVVKTPDGFGIVVGIEDGKTRVRLFGQTKEIEYKDVVKFDPETDIELLRQYYRNIFPEEYVEELLR